MQVSDIDGVPSEGLVTGAIAKLPQDQSMYYTIAYVSKHACIQGQLQLHSQDRARGQPDNLLLCIHCMIKLLSVIHIILLITYSRQAEEIHHHSTEVSSTGSRNVRHCLGVAYKWYKESRGERV